MDLTHAFHIEKKTSQDSSSLHAILDIIKLNKWAQKEKAVIHYPIMQNILDFRQHSALRGLLHNVILTEYRSLHLDRSVGADITPWPLVVYCGRCVYTTPVLQEISLRMLYRLPEYDRICLFNSNCKRENFGLVPSEYLVYTYEEFIKNIWFNLCV